MPGFLRDDVLPIAHVMENDPPLPCSRCGVLLPYAIMAHDPALQPGDPCEHEILALYPYQNEPVDDWREGKENPEKNIPYHLWRWIPLAEANLETGMIVRFFDGGFQKGHRDQPKHYAVVGMKIDQNLVFSDLHVVHR